MRDSIPFDTETRLEVLTVSPKNVMIQFILSRRKIKIDVATGIKGLFALEAIVRAFKKSWYTRPHRFTSFAPIRHNNECLFYVDGKGYYEDVFVGIENARSDVLIANWWLSPELPLVRPIIGPLATERSRLDFTLKRAADRGVKVYIILFKEFFALNNSSKHAKKTLEALSPNIKVLRHPNVIVSLWSHHEKMVVIDRATVFLGGLDLCWGRFDGSNHPLFNDPDDKTYPGIDYYNPLKKEIKDATKIEDSYILKEYPRMPWHDVAICIKGAIATDYSNHFLSYWNHARESNHENEILFTKKLSHIDQV